MNFYLLFAICGFPLVFLESTEEPNYYEPVKDFSSLKTNLNGTLSEEAANYENEDTNKETKDEVSEEAPFNINTEDNANEAEIDVKGETTNLSDTNEETENLNEGVSESKDNNDQGTENDNDDGIEGDNDDSTRVEHESIEENNVDSTTKRDNVDEIDDDDDEENKQTGRDDDDDTEDNTNYDMPKGYYIDPGVGANGQNLTQTEIDEFYKVKLLPEGGFLIFLFTML